MKSTGVFTKNLPSAIDLESRIYDSISDLLDMIDYSEKNNTSYRVHDNSLYNHAIHDTDFQTWIYDTSDIELKSIKLELLKRIWRAESIDTNKELVSVLDKSDCFSVGKPSPSFVWHIKDFLFFKQNRLKLITSKSEFGQELPDCYENIFFDEGVPASLNTLQASFTGIRDEIVLHLHKLDAFFIQLCSIRSGKGYDNKALSMAFFKFAHIPCSPQAGRDGVATLKRKYLNNKINKMEELVCELHTKFSTNNRSGVPDRIYFHPGKPDICEGKIIVIHIGKHA